MSKINGEDFKLITIIFSSPIRTPLIDNEIVLMNTLYKERFPKATQQMEERLKNFILDHERFGIHCCETDKIFHMFRLSEPSEDVTIDHDSVAIVRFVHHQLLEMARDCLLKSTERLVTSRYILIRLMNECFTGKTLFSDISTRCLKTWRSCWSRQETSHQKLLLT